MCRICGCGHYRLCNPPRGWAHKKGDKLPICTTCADFITRLGEFIEASGASKAGVMRAYVEARKD